MVKILTFHLRLSRCDPSLILNKDKSPHRLPLPNKCDILRGSLGQRKIACFLCQSWIFNQKPNFYSYLKSHWRPTAKLYVGLRKAPTSSYNWRTLPNHTVSHLTWTVLATLVLLLIQACVSALIHWPKFLSTSTQSQTAPVFAFSQLLTIIATGSYYLLPQQYTLYRS